MYISMNWIQEFVDLSGLDLMALIHQFSLSTAEVENEIWHKGADLSGVVVAEIKSIENHPESKKLHLLKVDCGEDELVDVVCGAPNVRVGMKTAFAKLGAQLGEITIAPRKLAGYTSHGMCCSEKELGISENNDGILDITEDVAVGTDVKALWQIDDIVFEVDNKSLTNRPDLWGHYGIAREFATLAKRPLKPMEVVDLTKYSQLPQIDMKIEDPLCQRYSCLTVENITRNVSPMNMRIRLYYCGMRAINLLADLTNYLMLEMGQPMHAFDSRKVEKIRIKRFKEPSTFQTLDKVDRAIDENTLMICNGDKPVAIAGIMGGFDSEIVADTTSLTLESATFDAASVRKSTVRLAHRTDASARYEKSLDPEMTVPAIARFVKLLQDVDSGMRVTSSLTDEYAFHYPQVTLDFDKHFVDRYTGIEISNEHIISTLTALGFTVRNDGDQFSVDVPSWRATKDVTIKADIIEEITRIYGYDNFDVHTAESPLYPVRAQVGKTVEDKLKDILVKRYSLHETHSYIWQYTDEYRKLGIEVEDNVKLLNATNPNIEVIRNSIIPTQLCQVKINTGYAPSFGIFEVGRTADGYDEKGLVREYKKLAITLFSKTADVQTLYFKLRDMLSVAVNDLKHKALTWRQAEAAHSWQHPKNLNAILCDGAELGHIGVVHPVVGKKIDKKAAIVFAEIDVEKLAAITPDAIVYREPSRFPGMEQDLTFIAQKYEPIAKAIEAANSPLIQKAVVTGTYTDESGKSITVRLTFSHNERTLTREEVQAVVDGITADLAAQGIVIKK
ncbi:MAG: phenylalanine--tRNA ligase subunit beta [Clostridia bacterium]|nr:phenylalanine--tRNA ligase subunit beta [Clostridia bacterium]